MKLLYRPMNVLAQWTMDLSRALMLAVPDIDGYQNWKPLRSIIARACVYIGLTALITALFVACLLMLTACQPKPSTSPEKITTSELVRKQQDIIKRGHDKAVWTGELVTGLTRENVDDRQPKLAAAIGVGEGNKFGIIQDFSDLANTTGSVQLSVAKVENDNRQLTKKVEKLEAKPSPEKFWYTLIGTILSAAGVAVTVLGFIPTPWTAWAAPFRGWAIAGAIVGFVLLTLARFLDIIEIIIGVTLGVAFLLAMGLLAFYAWRNRRRFLDTVDHIQAGVNAGQIIITPEAKDPNRSVSKAWLPDGTAKAIEARQKKLRKQNATPTPDRRPIKLNIPEPRHTPNPNIAANGPFNVTASSAAPPATA